MLTRELLRTPFKAGDALYDQVFGLAESVTISDNGDAVIQIGDAPVVLLNDKVRDENPEFAGFPIVNEVRDGKTPYFLFSGGTFLRGIFPSDNGQIIKLAVLQRDAGAPSDPGHYTTPAGRCGEPLGQNSIVETNEEMLITTPNGQVLAFYGAGLSEAEAHSMKAKQIQDRLGSVSAAIQTIEMDPAMPGPGLNKVTTLSGGEVVDEVYGIAFLDEKVRTLEVRVPLDVELSPDASIIDGEAFGRNAAFLTKEELLELPTVSALRNYLAIE